MLFPNCSKIVLRHGGNSICQYWYNLAGDTMTLLQHCKIYYLNTKYTTLWGSTLFSSPFFPFFSTNEPPHISRRNSISFTLFTLWIAIAISGTLYLNKNNLELYRQEIKIEIKTYYLLCHWQSAFASPFSFYRHLSRPFISWGLPGLLSLVNSPSLLLFPQEHCH